MYRRPKFLEVLIDIRQEMARDADYDVDLFAEIVRSGKGITKGKRHDLVGPGVENSQTTSVEEPKIAKRKTTRKS